VADAEPRRSHRVHPSQHRAGPRGPSRPRGVDRQVGAAGPEHLHRPEEGLTPMESLLPLAKRVGEKLKARKETIGVSESSSGGLVSAVLLAVPGASAYFMGGAVVYTRPAGEAFLTATN